MSAHPTPDDAAELLSRADLARARVLRRGPRESWAFVGWGLFVALTLPMFDVLAWPLSAAVFTVACVGGWLVTRRADRLWHARVRTGTFRRARRAWVAWLVWYAALVMAASLLGVPVSWLWAAVGLLAGLPLVGYGAWLASQGR